MLTTDTFLTCLQQITPCRGWVQVGAGNGTTLGSGLLAQAPHGLAIEADPQAFKRLARRCESLPNWKALQALIADAQAEAVFHVASNPSESGLLEPALLTSLWRNLESRATYQVEATTLAAVLGSDEFAGDYNWLSIDCLPALRILQGMADRIGQFDVIELKVLDSSAVEAGAGCTLEECADLLSLYSLVAVHSEESTNPLIKRVVLVPDRQKLLEHERSLAADDKARQSAELQAQRDKLAVDRDQQAKLAAERLARQNLAEQELRELQAQQSGTDVEVGKLIAQLEILKLLLANNQSS